MASKCKKLASGGFGRIVKGMARPRKGEATLEELADALRVSKATASRNCGQGMPRSIDAARAWLLRRDGRGYAPPPTEDGPTVEYESTIAELEARIAAQKKHAARAIAAAARSLEMADPRESKDLNALSSAAQATLIALERELRQRRIEAGTLVPIESATAKFRGLLQQIVKRLDVGEVEFAERANPDAPGVALVEWRRHKALIMEDIANGGQ